MAIFIPVVYEDPWDMPPLKTSSGDVIMKIELYTKIKNKIPIPIFAHEGYWVDLVHSSYISALSMLGKTIWQRPSQG